MWNQVDSFFLPDKELTMFASSQTILLFNGEYSYCREESVSIDVCVKLLLTQMFNNQASWNSSQKKQFIDQNASAATRCDEYWEEKRGWLFCTAENNFLFI